MEKQATLRIPALHCGGCEKTVTKTLQALPGVSVTQTDSKSKLVHLRYDHSVLSLSQIRASLEMAGFAPDEEGPTPGGDDD